jgi:hypothetical protein
LAGKNSAWKRHPWHFPSYSSQLKKN